MSSSSDRTCTVSCWLIISFISSRFYTLTTAATAQLLSEFLSNTRDNDRSDSENLINLAKLRSRALILGKILLMLLDNYNSWQISNSDKFYFDKMLGLRRKPNY